MQKLCNDIYFARCAVSLSQEMLARRVGIARPTMSAIEQGKQNPSLVTALRIAHELQSAVEDLFFFERKRRTITL